MTVYAADVDAVLASYGVIGERSAARRHSAHDPRRRRTTRDPGMLVIEVSAGR